MSICAHHSKVVLYVGGGGGTGTDPSVIGKSSPKKKKKKKGLTPSVELCNLVSVVLQWQSVLRILVFGSFHYPV